MSISFHSFGLKKMSILSVIILILVVIAFLLIANFNDDSTQQKNISEDRVKFMERDLGQKEVTEIIEIVKEYESKLYQKPQDTYLDPVSKGVIPGLAGKELDVDTTVSKILNAEQGEHVEPEYNKIPPEKTIEDYPAAPIYQGNPEKKEAAFICNVAWGTEYIDSMLKVLKDHQVEISFFLEGRWANNNQDEVIEIYADGHELENHAYSHYLMSEIDRKTIREEITQTNEVIEEIVEEKPKLFGPPAGDFDDDVLEEASKLDMRTILWSLDTVDWTEPGVNYMVDKIVDNIHPGALILIHPTEDTIKAVDQIITELNEKGYEIVTVSELISEY
ncbi:polysaccharide deacetylase family protein [Natranaerobius trueperi]|uniref:NodB homology domain-containing protein n=1 Tax=Natranaerobius trueperi TaxID=759412 RepID=A0A226BZ28_9FIRM|nr:polysaccharide deacetylase family protein [Natranaerobius trueperi]OWZ84283.1 hypothetical protein CDO51_04285 [Natranaerobius trueperi]